jgi:hydrogenase expression/formation protein HypC
MCLAFPGKIIEIKNDFATVDYRTEKRKAKLLEKSYKTGDYVIVQAGIVVQKVSRKEALESLKLIDCL